MKAEATLTYISSTADTIKYGDRAGQQFFRGHFTDDSMIPVSLPISGAVFSRLQTEAAFGDVLLVVLELRQTQSGVYTSVSDFKK